METIKNAFLLLVFTFAAMTLIFNLKNDLPRFPWDMLVDKFGFRLYLPVTSALVVALLLAVTMRFFNP